MTPLWLAGCTYNEAQLSPIQVAGTFLSTGTAAVYSGVLPDGGALQASAGSGMTLNIGGGWAVIANSLSPTNGGYLLGNMSQGTLTVATSDGVNPRIDLACATVSDLGSAASTGFIQILTGTPTTGATTANLLGAPALPSNSLALCYLLVPANSASVTAGNISDVRVFTVTAGGIDPVPSLANVPVGYQGSYIHDRTTGRLAHNPQGGPAQPKVLPFAPQQASRTTPIGSVLPNTTVASVSVTTDGSTDLEIIAKWPSVFTNNSGTFGQYAAAMLIQIDGSTIAEVVAPAATNATNTAGGGTLHHVTSSGVDRPSAAAHTVTFVLVPAGDGVHQVTIPAAATAPATLYVRPAPL